MSEQLRVQIAEWCGWTHCKLNDPNADTFEAFVDPSGVNPDTGEREIVPGYDLSLDDIHEAEKRLGGEGWRTYLEALAEVVTQEAGKSGINRHRDAIWHILHATALQRATALGRVINQERE